MARGDHARTAYLSLNRGEGGQNIIGTELFDALGVIRTEELLQARRLDGGEQFFTRSFDYGFSKTRAEGAGQVGRADAARRHGARHPHVPPAGHLRALLRHAAGLATASIRWPAI
jgi:hypothetical protein